MKIRMSVFDELVICFQKSKVFRKSKWQLFSSDYTQYLYTQEIRKDKFRRTK
jgi:predicted transcriptional regulator